MKNIFSSISLSFWTSGGYLISYQSRSPKFESCHSHLPLISIKYFMVIDGLKKKKKRYVGWNTISHMLNLGVASIQEYLSQDRGKLKKIEHT
jgi:hypothetical protein